MDAVNVATDTATTCAQDEHSVRIWKGARVRVAWH